MSQPSRYKSLSASQFELVNSVCELFEQELVKEKDVSIHSHLEKSPPAVRRVMFEELLAIELDWRFARCESPDISELRTHFPEFSNIVERLFEEASGARALRLDAAHKKTTMGGPADEFVSDKKQPSQQFASQYFEQAGTNIGPYELVEAIGDGGMGTVWRARQQHPVTRDVALKLIKIGMDTQQVVARFEAERQALAMMDHPNIARVLDVGSTDVGRPFFVMELVHGERITEYCDGHRMSIGARLELFVAVCNAIQHAHQKGVIHRDIKPSNVLVEDFEGNPIPKVIDFGLAKATGQKLTEKTLFTAVGQMLGTPKYMSPEQARMSNEDIDTRTDVYSLGVLLYELLAGTTPLDYQIGANQSHEAILRAIREDDSPRMSSRLAILGDAAREIAVKRGSHLKALHYQLQGDLDVIAQKALEKDRERRYLTPRDLADDIQRYLRHETIEARPASVFYRLSKTAVRNKVAVVLLTLLTASLLIGGVVSVLQLIRATNAERELAGQLLVAKRLTTEAEARNTVERWERYRSTMDAVGNAMSGSEDVGMARRYLDTAPTEHRGWEWSYYNNRLQDSSLVMLDFKTGDLSYCPVFAMHPTRWQLSLHQPNGKAAVWAPEQIHNTALEAAYPNGASAIAYSNDGGLVAVAADDFTIHVWNTESGERLCHLVGQQKTVLSLAFHPDGSQIATGGFENAVRAWDIATGKLLWTRKLPAQCSGLTYSRDGARLTISSGKKVVSVEHDTNRVVVEYNGATTEIAHSILSTSGRLLAAGTSDPANEVLVWDFHSGELLATMRGHSNQISGLVFDTSGSRIASISLDQTTRLWDVKTGTSVHVFRGHTAPIFGLAINSDGTRLITGSRDETARCWDTQTGEQVAVFRGHQAEVSQVAFSQDGAKVVSASFDGTIRVWESQADKGKQLRGHDRYVYDVAFHPTENQVASVGWDGKLLQWNLDDSRRISTSSHPSDVVTSVEFDSLGKRIVTLSRHSDADREGRSLMIWEHETGALLKSIPVLGPSWVESRADVSPPAFRSPWHDGKTDHELMAVGVDAGQILIFGLAAGKQLAILEGHRKGIQDVAFRPSLVVPQLASCSKDLTVRIWDLAEQREVATLAGHKSDINRVLYSSDGQILASASSDKTVRLWDADTHVLLAELPHGSVIYGLAFHPDGTRLATACADKTIRLWDLRRYQEVGKLRGHQDYVHAVAFSPDGSQIISASGDSSIRIWDTLSVGERLRRESE